MWLISRKWHKGWGIPGTEVYGTEMEQKMQMGRGWEWWPGIFWQFIWAWVVAPYILWNSRNIRDTQGWRIQTVGCALAGYVIHISYVLFVPNVLIIEFQFARNSHVAHRSLRSSYGTH